MKCLDRQKLLEFMTLRKDTLYDQLVRDWTGEAQSRIWEHRELKYWKEAIERGEFDTPIDEVYIILSKTQPEIVDFTFYTDRQAVYERVEEMNKLAKCAEYWYITLFSNSRNMDEMTPTGFPACPNCGNPTVTKGQYCSVECAENASK